MRRYTDQGPPGIAPYVPVLTSACEIREGSRLGRGLLAPGRQPGLRRRMDYTRGLTFRADR